MLGHQFLRSGFSYLLIGDYDQALNAFARAIAADKNNAAYAFHGSMTAWRSGQYDLARQWAQNAVTLEPENQLYAEHLKMISAQQLLDEAKTALNNGQLPQAKKLLDEALSTDPLNEQALNLQKNVAMDMGVNDG